MQCGAGMPQHVARGDEGVTEVSQNGARGTNVRQGCLKMVLGGRMCDRGATTWCSGDESVTGVCQKHPRSQFGSPTLQISNPGGRNRNCNSIFLKENNQFSFKKY